MPRHRNKDKRLQKKIAKDRVQYLFRLAETRSLNGELGLADRYVFHARKISMRYLVPMPREFKRRFCKYCYSYLVPDVNCRVRIHRGKIITYCTVCGKHMRIPLDTRDHTHKSKRTRNRSSYRTNSDSNILK